MLFSSTPEKLTYHGSTSIVTRIVRTQPATDLRGEQTGLLFLILDVEARDIF